MSGHSKWSTIKHKKAALDAKRGRAWSKLARDVTMAARHGGGDLSANPRLRLAVDKAKGANMPKDTIEKAIKKGTGELAGEAIEEIVYEGYGPGGVAIMCTCLTDNRHRTAPEVKKIFERGNGNLGAPNCVSWMFSKKGVFVIAREAADEDKVMEVALENGAEDVNTSDMAHEVTCDPDAYGSIKEALEAAGIAIQSADVTMVAASQITLDVDTARKVLRLMENLEEHDDVQSVSSNFDIPDDVMAELAKES